MKRGEIYVVDLGLGVGSEASGVRPVVVLSNDLSNEFPISIVVVPTINASAGTEKSGVAVPARQSGYPVDLIVLSVQPRTLDPSRFPEHPSGAVPPPLMDKIGYALKVFLDIK